MRALARFPGRRSWRPLAVAAVVLAFAVQLVPYGWEHPNPPVTLDAPWPTPEAEELARRACYSCHSNETDWPAYAYVAPMSWLVRDDVERGRDELNFSEWDRDGGEADDAADELLDGSMPPLRFTLLHRDADLDDAERRTLVEALLAMDEAR